MEIGVVTDMPTYSGGLGVLAGDTVRAAADLKVPMVAVTLLHRKGYFRQHLDSSGNQTESSAAWLPERNLEPLPARILVAVEGRPVAVCAWRYLVEGVSGHVVPVYFLDTAIRFMVTSAPALYYPILIVTRSNKRYCILQMRNIS